jgi:hypothetical protein
MFKGLQVLGTVVTCSAGSGTQGECLILGGHAAICWVYTRNPGYHCPNVASQSSFKTRVRKPR